MEDLHYHTLWGSCLPDFSGTWTFTLHGPWISVLFLGSGRSWSGFPPTSQCFCLPGWLLHFCSLSYFMYSSVFTLRCFLFQYVINFECTYIVVSEINFISPALTSLLSSECAFSRTCWNFHLRPTQSNTGLTSPCCSLWYFCTKSCYPMYSGSRELC